MNKRMIWQEIQSTYPNQWVGMIDVEWNKGGVKSAIVKYTDKIGDELIGLQIADENIYSKYTTPNNVLCPVPNMVWEKNIDSQ